MPINDAGQFAALLTSARVRDRDKALRQRMADGVWQRIIVEHPELRRWLPFHRKVPDNVLAQLGQDPDAEVRWAVAYSPHASRSLLTTLSQDPDWRVRTGVAGNRWAPRQLTRRLLYDTHPQVAFTAQGELGLDGVTGGDSPRTSRFDLTRWLAARGYRYWPALTACLAVAVIAVLLRPALRGYTDISGAAVIVAGLLAAVLSGYRFTLTRLSWRPWHADIPESITYIVSIK